MPSPRLPTVEQIVMAPERPTLAALDTLLELAIRSLLAENPGLTQKPSAPPSGRCQSRRPPTGSRGLRPHERVYGDGQGEVDDVDDDMPF